MKRVYAFSIGTHLKQTISLPRDAVILSIHPKDDTAVLYALVSPEASFVQHTLYAFTTGAGLVEESVADLRYLDTVSIHNGSYVVHYFLKV